MINNLAKNLSTTGPWIQEIKGMLTSVEHFRVTWTQRSANVAAHKLAKVGVGEERSELWLVTPPDFILDVISDDIPNFFIVK